MEREWEIKIKGQVNIPSNLGNVRDNGTCDFNIEVRSPLDQHDANRRLTLRGSQFEWSTSLLWPH